MRYLDTNIEWSEPVVETGHAIHYTCDIGYRYFRFPDGNPESARSGERVTVTGDMSAPTGSGVAVLLGTLYLGWRAYVPDSPIEEGDFNDLQTFSHDPGSTVSLEFTMPDYDVEVACWLEQFNPPSKG